MRIAFVNLDWSNIRDPATDHPTPGGAGWYRMAMPADFLKRNGVDVVLGKQIIFDPTRGVFCTTDWEGNQYRDLDVVILQRWMDEIAPTAIQLARAGGQIVINDVDDYFDGIHPTNQAWHLTHPKVSPKANRSIYRKVLSVSSGLMVSTPFLQEKMSILNENVQLVRNAIDLERWTPQKVAGPPVLGWVGATSYRSEDLQVITHPVGEFLRSNPQAGFFHGGAQPGQNLNDVPFMMGATPEQASGEAMQGILDYPKLFQNFNVGLVPLNDIPFNHAKSAIKGMEYAASGIPFIASPTPEYQWLEIEHGIGLTVRKPKFWKNVLHALADEDYRIMLGAEYAKRVQALDIAGKWRSWLTAIERISANERAGLGRQSRE